MSKPQQQLLINCYYGIIVRIVVVHDEQWCCRTRRTLGVVGVDFRAL